MTPDPVLGLEGDLAAGDAAVVVVLVQAGAARVARVIGRVSGVSKAISM